VPISFSRLIRSLSRGISRAIGGYRKPALGWCSVSGYPLAIAVRDVSSSFNNSRNKRGKESLSSTISSIQGSPIDDYPAGKLYPQVGTHFGTEQRIKGARRSVRLAPDNPACACNPGLSTRSPTAYTGRRMRGRVGKREREREREGEGRVEKKARSHIRVYAPGFIGVRRR
jgi:hypothetical protein